MSDREEFERTVRATWSDSYSFMRDSDGHYCDEVLDGMWWTWQAKADVGAVPVATLLTSDPYEEADRGPWLSMKDWRKLRDLPAGTKLYTHPQQPAQGQWVKCAERLPTEGDGPVLMCFLEPFFGNFTQVLEAGYYDQESEAWRFWTLDREVKGGGVTHWMPLPNPPAGGE